MTAYFLQGSKQVTTNLPAYYMYIHVVHRQQKPLHLEFAINNKAKL